MVVVVALLGNGCACAAQFRHEWLWQNVATIDTLLAQILVCRTQINTAYGVGESAQRISS